MIPCCIYLLSTHLEGVPELGAEYHDEPVEASEENHDGHKPVGHDIIASLNLVTALHYDM